MVDIDLTKTYSGTDKPENVYEVYEGRRFMYFPYIISDVDGVYTWKYILMRPADYNYSGLINAIIGIDYNLKDTLAVMNNYLAEPKNAKYKKEFEEMQKVRKAAKEYSKKHFNVE